MCPTLCNLNYCSSVVCKCIYCSFFTSSIAKLSILRRGYLECLLVRDHANEEKHHYIFYCRNKLSDEINPNGVQNVVICSLFWWIWITNLVYFSVCFRVRWSSSKLYVDHTGCLFIVQFELFLLLINTSDCTISHYIYLNFLCKKSMANNGQVLS